MLEYVWFATTLVLSILLLRARFPRRRRRRFLVVSGEQYALNIIINTDLHMQRGKVISQACHAVSGVMAASKKDDEVFDAWKQSGEAKIVLKAGMHEIAEVVRNARNRGVCVYKVYDAGRTQVLPGSNTAVAIGPAPKSVLSLLTGHLKLY